MDLKNNNLPKITDFSLTGSKASRSTKRRKLPNTKFDNMPEFKKPEKRTVSTAMTFNHQI
jgi:hypothetical protein